MTQEIEELQFKALTKIAGNGKVYHRRPIVEEQLLEISLMDLPTLERRVTVAREDSPGSLKSETLVALFRAIPESDLCIAVYDTINRRIQQILSPYRSKFIHRQQAEDFLDAVAFAFFEKILDPSDKADYAEVSFGEFVAFLATNEFRKSRRQMKIDEVTIMIDHPLGGDDALPHYQIAADGLDPEQELLFKEALRKLPVPIREAWILHRLYGWKIQSNNPIEPTLVKLFGKTERTIRAWIKKGDEILAGRGGL